MTSLAVNLIPVKNLRPPKTRYLKGVKPASPSMLKRGKQNKKLGDKVSVKMWKGLTMYSLSLGDFYDGHYILQWQRWMNTFPGMQVFGYTHHTYTSHLGCLIRNINNFYPQRFRIRFSDDWDTEFSAHVIDANEAEYAEHGIICPEQLGKTDSCSSCGYCWSSNNPVIFIEH